MLNLSIIIPILNEFNNIEKIINTIKTYPPTIEVHFCDGGSTDNSLEKLMELKQNLDFFIHQEKLASPSIQKTINLAIDSVKTKYFMIHPIDANAADALKMFLELDNPDVTHIIPHKVYDPSHRLLEIQEKVLNSLRVNILKSFVWTNCPIIRTEDYKALDSKPEGFLEDVLLSDQLKGLNQKPIIIKDSVIISSRRYQADGVFNRFLGNLLIMVLFRLKLKSIKELKKMYYKESD